jgi:coenzyme F420 hydrogenase subunit beta
MKPDLKSKFAFTIGLVCDRVQTYSALDYLVKKAISNNAKNVSISFRDKSVSGYPGDVHVFFENDKSVVMPANTRIQIKDYFTPARCRICFDKMNIFADITVGDPHGLEGIDRKYGESMVVARTNMGQEIVRLARAEKAIDIRPADYEQVLKGQMIGIKKVQWHNYLNAWEELGLQLPTFLDEIQKRVPVSFIKDNYKNKLLFSLSLDNFASRNELISFVEREVIKNHIINSILSPIGLSIKFAKKLQTMIRSLVNGN